MSEVKSASRLELEKKVADANHMSKPDSENMVVVFDADGRWIFEIYTAGARGQRERCVNVASFAN